MQKFVKAALALQFALFLTDVLQIIELRPEGLGNENFQLLKCSRRLNRIAEEMPPGMPGD